MILGIDEVGRGAWAGPVVVGAVAIEPDVVAGLADSKLLSKKKREIFATQIRQQAVWIGIGWVGAKQIDEIGMSAALKLAAQRAVFNAAEHAEEIIIDGTVKLIDQPNVTLLKKADQLIPAVSAASIIAKVARDNYMHSLHEIFPDYGFDKHVGYGTQIHRNAIEHYGPSPVHRMSFAPMSNVPVEEKVVAKTSGSQAETAAADYLRSQGFAILERNWKTKACEIDIVAEKNKTMHFVEVKYRKNAKAGAGFDYVTPKKQEQMAFAAEMWRAQAKWNGEMRLAAIEVSGEDFEIAGFTTDIPAALDSRVHTRQFGS